MRMNEAYLGVSVSVRAASVTVLSTLTERMKLFMIETFWKLKLELMLTFAEKIG
jgi:hypothetical protein